jgi:hypothetical protein
MIQATIRSAPMLPAASSMNAPANLASNPSAIEAAEVRVTQYDWKGLAEELSSHGCVVL